MNKRIFGDEIIRLLDDPDVLKATKAYDEVKEVLKELHNRGKKLGIVTSNNKKHVGDVLDFLGIDRNYFQIIVGNQETKKHKPNPDPILKAMELLGIDDKSKVTYVGDGLDDMRSAKNAEVTPILVDRLNEYKDECDIIIDDLNGLL